MMKSNKSYNYRQANRCCGSIRSRELNMHEYMTPILVQHTSQDNSLYKDCSVRSKLNIVIGLKCVCFSSQ